MIKDKDLVSVQEVRDMIGKAKESQEIFSKFSQEKIDKIIRAMAMAASNNSERLAKMAWEETGFGRWESKLEKNKMASTKLYEYIKDMNVIGVLNKDEEKKLIEIGVPVGVIAGLVPSTNPTSTVIYKSLISLKSGNAIIFSPHPSAKKCIAETVGIMVKAAVENGAPENLIQSMTTLTIQATNELMSHQDINLILATGGTTMVKAAYSSGNPALGVGPGNVPCFIERSADIKKAVSDIIRSKTFDNGIICASEESIITESIIKDEVMEEFKNQGAYFLNDEEAEKFKVVMHAPRGGLNAKIVGKDALTIAGYAGVEVPSNTKIILYAEKGVGVKYEFSKEKLNTLLGFYTVDNWEEACEIAKEILENDGLGHSVAIHSKNDDIILKFGLEKKVSRVLVNVPAAQGGVGLYTNLAPSFTLGCGAPGGSATSDNVTPKNLIDIRRIAYGVVDYTQECDEKTCEVSSSSNNSIDVDLIKELVMAELKKYSK